MPHRESLKDHSPDRLRELFRARGWPAYRADQVCEWLYVRGEEDPARWTNLPRDLREVLAREWEVRTLECVDTQRSVDGTRKSVLATRDGRRIESVLIPEEDRQTLCVSTQVGCPLACSFCATGAMGFTRNLSAAEIVDQLVRMNEQLDPGERISNVVFMGMGEPLLNTTALLEAIRILIHPKAFAMAPRRITVSTAGVVPQIGRLLDVAPVNLAVSLHATTDPVRDDIVPLNRKFPLDMLLGALRSDPRLGRRRPVFFEYILIDGVNDDPEDARRLARLLRGIPSKVNVIPMNPHADSPYRPPPDEVVDRFTAILHAANLRVTLRRHRGRDIDAACGQLALREEGSVRPGAADPAPPAAALVDR
ncbi:MAG: 23S rRNA (adenine(2503)-C(2))-methyltransferase RlmN [Myxococcota bacterium]